MELISLLTSLGTSFAIFVVLVIAYAVLSRIKANSVIYFPNKILRGKLQSSGSNGGGPAFFNPVSWISEAWSATEQDIISVAGLDAAVYILFLTSALTILVLATGICVPLLIPLSATDHNYEIQYRKAKDKNASSYDQFDEISAGNVQANSGRLWAFVFCAYWISFVTYYVLWRNYKHVLGLRTREQASSLGKPEQFAVLARDIPPVPGGQSRKEQVDSFFRRIYPETFETSIIVSDMSKAEKAWTELEGYRKKLARADVVFEKSKTQAKPEGTKPTMRTGFLGLLGKKVDSIDYLNEKIKETSVKLDKERKKTLADEQVSAAIIIFNTRTAAAAASQVVHSKMADSWTVTEAPEPRQILWSNLAISFYSRIVRQYSVYVLVALCIFFYMIPIAFISGITTLENLRKLLPFLKAIVDIKALRTVLEAYLPQLALILFLAFLPPLLLFMSKSEGIPSQSHAVRAASGKYFYFTVLNVFIGFTLSGTLFDAFKQVEKQPGKIISILGQSIPPRATFFISFVALKFFVGSGLELSRVVPLVVFNIKKKFLCKTEEEIREAWKPSGFSYATKVPADMLIITIALCYSVLAPMILPFAVLYFMVGWFITRNQAMNVCVPDYESYGRMWPHMNSRILGALFLSQLTMLAYFSLKFVLSPLLIPLPFATLVYAYICRQKFYPSFRAISMEAACHDLKDVPSTESLVKAFTPPCLQTEEKFADAEMYEDARATLPSRTASIATSDV